MADNKVGLFDKTKNFFGEVRTEMDKVSWPSREQVWTYTQVVLGSTAAISLLMGGWDMVLGWAIQRVLDLA